MRSGESVRVAAGAIAANRLRAGLTALGVVIGVMSVVLLISVGTGARSEITGQLEALGSNLVFAVPGGFEGGPTEGGGPSRSPFTADAIDDLANDLAGQAEVTGTLTSGEQARGPAGQTGVSAFGTTGSYDAVTDTDVTRGAFFSDADADTGRRVAVLGPSAAEELFGERDPLGQQVTLAGVGFEVVGLVEEAGTTFGVDADLQVLVPLRAAQELFGIQRVDTVLVRAPSPDALPGVVDEVEASLAQSIDEDRFSVLTQDDILGVVGDVLGTLTFVLAAIAGISLLVAGIGVSNIMLVSVSERTREIGLRKALGARTRDITSQFLIEALLLCGLGGLVGLGLGIGLAEVAEAVSPLPAEVTWWAIALAFGTSLGVGIVFGVLPARRAGRLDPAVALRHE